MQKARSS